MTLSIPFQHAGRALTAGLFCAALAGCDDPKREQQLQWREEEAEAKIAATAKRENAMTAERQRMEQEKSQLAAREGWVIEPHGSPGSVGDKVAARTAHARLRDLGDDGGEERVDVGDRCRSEGHVRPWTVVRPAGVHVRQEPLDALGLGPHLVAQIASLPAAAFMLWVCEFIADDGVDGGDLKAEAAAEGKRERQD
jgi:hypothetical protein